MIETPSSRYAAAGRTLISVLSFTASIPFQALYIPPAHSDDSHQGSDTVIRFTPCDRSHKKHKLWFTVLVPGIVAATLYSIFQMETQLILTGYLLVMLYHVNLKYQLGKFEKGNRLVYDQQFKVYEYRSAGKTVVFKNADIEKITLHVNGPQVRIAKVRLKSRTLQLTSDLVNFAHIPLLNENAVERIYHSFLFRVPH